MKTIIHVNQFIIKHNTKHGTNLPPLTIRDYKRRVNAHEVTIEGPSKIVHSPHKPLACGARVWVETESKVKVFKRKRR
jgi:hypothetical protein